MKSLIITLTVVFAITARGEPEGLETLRTTYRDQLSKIADEEMAAMASAQDQYIAALTSLEKQFQSAGKLEPLLKAQQEKDRFSRERTVTAQDISLDVREISNLQNQFIAATKAAPMAPAKKKLTLAGFYERSLKKLEEDLTKKNDIQGALAVKAERDGLAGRPELVAAQALVASTSKPEPRPIEQPVPVLEDVPVVEEVKGPASLSAAEKSRIEMAVKHRFNDFVDDVEDQDWENALEFVEPEYVDKTGEHIAKSVLKMKYGMARIVGDNPGSKIRSKEIKVEDTGDRATVVPELWARNKAHSLERMNWILVEGQWYLSLGAAKEGQGGGGHNQWQRPGKDAKDFRRKIRR